MSVSVTCSIPKKNEAKVVRRQRVFDYLYDPLYTVSSEVDHARAGIKAYTSKERVKKVTDFGSMFSVLPHYPRYAVQLDHTDPVPASVDRCWRGHTKQRKEALQQLAGVIPKTHSWLKKEECNVTGADGWKYLKRPLFPTSNKVPPDVVTAAPKEDPKPSVSKSAERPPSHNSVGIQTDYRESETQTDPYSPEYVVKSGTTPSELLTLAALTWGRGLPAGLAEVEMIEWAQARRAWEATLPPLDDTSQVDKRRHMMQEIEAKDWAFREGEIQRLQDARLVVLRDLQRQRNEVKKKVKTERLSQIYTKLQKSKETKLHKMHQDYMRSLRKLEAKRKNVEGKLERRDLVRDYPEHPSPATRAARDNEIKKRYLETYEGLLELESGLKLDVDIPKHIARDVVPKTPETKEAPPEKEEIPRPSRPLRFLVTKEQHVHHLEPSENDEIEIAVIHLQKLLRGRRVQYEMINGRENNLDIIKELRTLHTLQREEQALELISQEEAATMVGEPEQLFDSLSKELSHLQEERKIHAFTILAERERLLREAEENGCIDLEERRRKEEDDIFRQMVKVHQETVDLYLEDIILQTLEQTAEEHAREEIRRMAKEINDIAYAMEESRNNLQSEEIVSELVYSFLIPEIEKIKIRHKVHQSQHRHLQAARSIIQATAESSGVQCVTFGASELTCPSEKASYGVLEEMIGQQLTEEVEKQ